MKITNPKALETIDTIYQNDVVNGTSVLRSQLLILAWGYALRTMGATDEEYKAARKALLDALHNTTEDYDNADIIKTLSDSADPLVCGLWAKVNRDTDTHTKLFNAVAAEGTELFEQIDSKYDTDHGRLPEANSDSVSYLDITEVKDLLAAEPALQSIVDDLRDLRTHTIDFTSDSSQMLDIVNETKDLLSQYMTKNSYKDLEMVLGEHGMKSLTDENLVKTIGMLRGLNDRGFDMVVKYNAAYDVLEGQMNDVNNSMVLLDGRYYGGVHSKYVMSLLTGQSGLDERISSRLHYAGMMLGTDRAETNDVRFYKNGAYVYRDGFKIVPTSNRFYHYLAIPAKYGDMSPHDRLAKSINVARQQVFGQLLDNARNDTTNALYEQLHDLNDKSYYVIRDELMKNNTDIRKISMNILQRALADDDLHELRNVDVSALVANSKELWENVDKIVGLEATDKIIPQFSYNAVMSYAPGMLVDDTANSVPLEQLLRANNIDATMLLDDDITKARIAECLISYDEASGRTLSTIEKRARETDDIHESARLKSVARSGRYIEKVLTHELGVSDVKVRIDDNGVVRWTGNVFTNEYTKIPVMADLGQVFGRDDRGVLHTSYNGHLADRDLVVSAKGWFVNGDKPLTMIDDPTTQMNESTRLERLRVASMEHVLQTGLHEVLMEQLAHVYYGTRRELAPLDNFNGTSYHNLTSFDSLVALNHVYHDDLVAQDINPSLLRDGDEHDHLSREFKDAVIKSLASRVSFPKNYRDDATSFSSVSKDVSSHGSRNTNAARLNQGLNMRIIWDDLQPVFDARATGSGKVQGTRLVMLDKVYDDFYSNGGRTGKLKPQKLSGYDVFGERSVLRNLPVVGEFQKYDPADRVQMATAQFENCCNLKPQANVAMTTMGGWTKEDSMVVSKKFADEYQIVGADGKYRPLQVGDKLSGAHGNKGTISLVIDPDMKDPEHVKLADGVVVDLRNEVAMFKQNPDLDVVFSPENPVSRLNMGLLQQVKKGTAKPISMTLVDGEKRDLGTMFQLPIMVTNMAVDKKSHVYTREDSKKRAFSSQHMWVMSEVGANDLSQAVFGQNMKPYEHLRQHLRALNKDVRLNSDGKFINGIDDVGENTHVYDIQQLYETRGDDSALGAGHTNSPSSVLADAAQYDQAYIKLPVSVTDIDGNKTDIVPLDKSVLRNDLDKTNNFGFNLQRRSSILVNYQDMIAAGYHYLRVYNRLNVVRDNNGKDVLNDKQKEQLTARQKAINTAFVTAQSTIVRHAFGGLNGRDLKTSSLRQELLKKEMPNSATLVLTNNPLLQPDTIILGQEAYDNLHLKDKDELVYMFRDPVNYTGSVRAMHVARATDANFKGCAINPLMDKSLEADHDGDTVGVIAFHDKKVQKDLQKFLPATNYTQTGATYLETNTDFGVDEVAGAIGAGMEVQPDSDGYTVKDRLNTADLNTAMDIKEAQTTTEKVAIMNKRLGQLSEMTHNNFGVFAIDGRDSDHMFKSLSKIIESGAKGKPEVLNELHDWYEGFENHEHPDNARRDVNFDIQSATGYKADDTALAGAYGQQIITALHALQKSPEEVKEVMDGVVHPVVQLPLQVKHHSERAHLVDNVLGGSLAVLSAGGSINRQGQLTKYAVTKKQLCTQYQQVLNTKLGLDVSDKAIQELTDVQAYDGKEHSFTNVTKYYGTALDQLAYGRGYATIKRFCNEERSLVDEFNTSSVPYMPRHLVKTVQAYRQKQAEKAKARDQQAEMNVEQTKVVEKPHNTVTYTDLEDDLTF